ncbi:AI-2E family transporter [Pseudonocardia sulfidoxydans NBRC 16205]|uniref:AI-2E family transporter n=1 Tax=Pseudonocardia sulfidoxydans NBRC 16205 TaxID=1223511 RepID=A0A511D8H6_9PSEU|nr:AI-2E family transporter [Pseudonocardia sulfidoxydans]GEL21082.1 AI-2E family transporter [Pseudonocardia sulfidoxydans NBRC 16205]
MTQTVPGDRGDEVLPTGMPRGLVVVLAVTGLLVSTLALQQFSSIVAPVLLALILVIGVHPLTGNLTRRGVPRWLAATVSLVVVLAIIIGLAASLALSVARLGTLLPMYQDRFVALLDGLRAWLAGLGVGPEQLQNLVGQIDFGKVAGVVTDLLAGLASTFTNLLFLIFVVLFMSVDALGFSHRLRQVGGRQPAIVSALRGFVTGTRSYLFVATLFGLIVAVVDTVFLWIAGVPLALLWGLLAFVTNYIPNIGFIIGLVPPALLALLEGGPKLMLIVIVAYCVINFVIQSLIQPKYVSDAVNLSLTLTFLSLVFWAFVIGPLGAVLAIPLTLLTKALLLDVDPRTRWMSAFLVGGKAGPDEPASSGSPPDGPSADVASPDRAAPVPAVPDPQERDVDASPTPQGPPSSRR